MRPLPGGRERCFGHYEVTSRYCERCPAWPQLACIEETPGARDAKAIDPELMKLRALVGG